jgi:hypothetical protein
MASMRCRNEFGKYRGTVESGLPPGNPIGQVQWRAPSAAATVNPAVVASPAQVRAMLPRSPASSRTWPRSSAACITRRYAPKKPSPCVTMTSAPRTRPREDRAHHGEPEDGHVPLDGGTKRAAGDTYMIDLKEQLGIVTYKAMQKARGPPWVAPVGGRDPVIIG